MYNSDCSTKLQPLFAFFARSCSNRIFSAFLVFPVFVSPAVLFRRSPKRRNHESLFKFMVGLVFHHSSAKCVSFSTSTAHMCANKRARRSSTSSNNIAMFSRNFDTQSVAITASFVSSVSLSRPKTRRELRKFKRLPSPRVTRRGRFYAASFASVDPRSDNRQFFCSILRIYRSNSFTWTKGALDRAAASWTITG